MFMDFIGCCMDQLMNQLAKMKYMFGGKARLPVTVMTAAGAGVNLAAQHSQSLEALVCHIPGLKVVMPSNAYDAKGLLIASIRDDDPVIFIQHKLLLGDDRRRCRRSPTRSRSASPTSCARAPTSPSSPTVAW